MAPAPWRWVLRPNELLRALVKRFHDRGRGPPLSARRSVTDPQFVSDTHETKIKGRGAERLVVGEGGDALARTSRSVAVGIIKKRPGARVVGKALGLVGEGAVRLG